MQLLNTNNESLNINYMSIKNRQKKATNLLRKTIIPFFVLSGIIIVALLVFLRYQKVIFAPNVNTGDVKEAEIFIPSNPTFDEVVDILKFSGYIIDIDNFIWVAERKNYPSNVRGGLYILKDKMSNNELVNMLRAGFQTPVILTFNCINSFEDLAGHLSKRLEPDSIQFLNYLKNEEIYEKFGFNKHTFISMFIPNTYQIYWNTTPEAFALRMHQEYKRFWNDERIKKAEQAGLTPLEVSILSTIVDEETNKNSEKPRVAGLYINRLRKGMNLQADPTIKFVLGDFSVTRILTRDLKIDSPYNTYIYAGLPPGPIRMPSIQGIEAVLNYEKNDYIFMCAKEDFSGYHNFAKTLEQHNRNAEKYRQALNNYLKNKH